MKTIHDIISEIVNREGKFVNNPKDKGKATKYGITIETLSAWRGKPCTVDDVKNLTIAEAKEIYLKRYSTYSGIENGLLLEQMIDAGVNHGVTRSKKLLQSAVKVVPDGIIGKQTKAAIDSNGPIQVCVRFLAVRARYYGDILIKDHTQWTFAAGWFNRYAEMVEQLARQVKPFQKDRLEVLSRLGRQYANKLDLNKNKHGKALWPQSGHWFKSLAAIVDKCAEDIEDEIIDRTSHTNS